MEDDFLIADDFTRRLAQSGAEVLGPAATLDGADTLYRKEPPPHVAVLDINLRGTPVFPFAGQLQRDNIPFVFCTGYGDDPIAECFRHVPRFEKPLSKKGFVDMIAEIARLYAGRRSTQ
ncbi:response regulator [Blastomonas sp. AAP53]|uniref:response regulator n=1 Tax=Blastomonas sp. AAP53 TaxID=1248760 RepID=UPI001930CE21|nr:response regulator [Blastomonas sp. AAP53]